MKIIVLSDLHGYLPILEDFDLLLIGGDVCPVNCHTRQYQEDWLHNEFVEWINGLQYRDVFSRVVMIAGNHDFYFESISKKNKDALLRKVNDNRLVYLDNEEYTFEYIETELKSVKIFGCPYCKVFGSWAFMRENLDKYYSPIPEDIDILLTHDAADINNLGMIQMGPYKGENAGNKILAEHVKRVKPEYYFCGHIHSGNHELTEVDGIKMANVSIMNENYHPTHKPLVIDYKEVPGVVYPLFGDYIMKVDDGHGEEEGTELIAIFTTYEKALHMQKTLEEGTTPRDDYRYERFRIDSYFVL